MNKNKTKISVIILVFAVVVFIALMGVTFWEKVNEVIALVTISALLVFINIALYIWKSTLNKKSDSQMFELGNKKQKKIKKHFHTFLFTIVICALLLSRQLEINIRTLTIILLTILTIDVFVLRRKFIVLDSTGIRYPLKWNLKWEVVKDYIADKKSGVLNLETVDGQKKQLRGIQDMDPIIALIAKYRNDETKKE